VKPGECETGEQQGKRIFDLENVKFAYEIKNESPTSKR
jgi:hypothetical protein